MSNALSTDQERYYRLLRTTAERMKMTVQTEAHRLRNQQSLLEPPADEDIGLQQHMEAVDRHLAAVVEVTSSLLNDDAEADEDAPTEPPMLGCPSVGMMDATARLDLAGWH